MYLKNRYKSVYSQIIVRSHLAILNATAIEAQETKNAPTQKNYFVFYSKLLKLIAPNILSGNRNIVSDKAKSYLMKNNKKKIDKNK